MVDPTELWSSHIQSGVTWKDRRYWDKLNPRRGFQAPLGSFLVAWKTVQVWRLKELISPLGDSVSPEGVCVAVEETRKSCIRSGPCSGLHGHLTATRLWVQTSWSMSPFYVVCMFYHSSNTYFFFFILTVDSRSAIGVDMRVRSSLFWLDLIDWQHVKGHPALTQWLLR